LALEPSVSLAFVERPEETAAADMVILPGTKQTLDDLRWLEQRGFAHELQRRAGTGVPIIGICGGFQMLGTAIDDPEGIENHGQPARQTGLALLPVRTVLRTEKTMRRVHGSLRCDLFGGGLRPGAHFEGYEIHVGETVYETGALPFAAIERSGTTLSVPDGAVSESGRLLGTYVHGLFDNDDFRHGFLRAARAAVDLAPTATWAHVTAEREVRIDRLACHLRRSLDTNLIKSWIVAPSGRGPENYRG
jgi:adenosylcobyric acid synthase